MQAARERFARSLEGFRALSVPWGLGNALSGLARVAVAGADLAEAEAHLAEATLVPRHAGPWFLSPTLSVRGTVAVLRGKPDEALALTRESLISYPRAP